jgi:hypothetical protein
MDGGSDSQGTVHALVDTKGVGDGFTAGATTTGGEKEKSHSHTLVLVFTLTLLTSLYSEKKL